MSAWESLDYKGHRTEGKLPETSILLKAVTIRRMKTFGACIHTTDGLSWRMGAPRVSASPVRGMSWKKGAPISSLVPQMAQGLWTTPALLNTVRPQKMLDLLTTGHRLPCPPYTWLYISSAALWLSHDLSSQLLSEVMLLPCSEAELWLPKGHGMVQECCPTVASLLGQ